MTPEQALALLSQVSGQVSANREVHLKIIEAIDILKEKIKQ